MFFMLVLCQLALAAANPFHKYPYVFLLDIGNEELEKTNTEQIRLSIPGGSLAIRYPAIGNGDTISHVRVSGIDFGTDLKANIIDGGPGYKYVVLVFMGNPGVPYDAVMTIQTVSDKDINDNNQSNGAYPNTSSINLEDANNSAEEIDDDTTNTKSDNLNNNDVNDSSEDTSDDTDTQKDTSGNAEISQESSNIYSYAKNDVEGTEDGNDEDDNSDDDNNQDENNDDDSDGDSDESEDDLSNQNDIHKQYSESKQAVELKDYQKYSDMSYEYTADQNAPQESDNVINVDGDDDDKPARVMDSSIYQSYAMIRPGFYNGVRFYPQNSVPFLARENSDSAYDPEDSLEFGRLYNDEGDHSQLDKYRDSNNNFDADDSSAVVS